MKQLLLLPLCVFWLSLTLVGQSTALYDDTHVSKIFVEMPADSLTEMIDQLVNDYYYHSRFIFDDGVGRDTVENAGIRLRGNTSLVSRKKSFKISFNEYETGREYQGVRKLNLLGSHNDPTMIREKLFYEVWEKAGMAVRRASFTQLYINGEYRGLYTNMEEIDKQWLTRTFGENDGNLYKCTYPADLVYMGNYQSIYKSILNNPETRAYDLVTNETADDYTRFVELLRLLYQPVDGNFATNISTILNVQNILKSFAIDVATGNWDDYFYNKNNYYLYDNPTTGRFEFVTYDTDNTFGVDWLGKDWAKRNCLQWQHSQQPRPLASKLLEVPAFHAQFVHYLDSVSRFIVHPDSIFSRIDYLHQLITPAAETDIFRTLDYGYSIAKFHQGFTQTVDGHTPYGIKPFLALRYDSTMRQIAHLVVSDTKEPQYAPLKVAIYPNPAADRLFLRPDRALADEMIFASVYDMFGRTLKHWQWKADAAEYEIGLQDLPPGVYQIQLHSDHQQGHAMFVKVASGY